MKRRKFIQGVAAVAPLMLSGLPLRVLGRESLFSSVLGSAPENDRILVIIQLFGGNDGLNTVIPLDQYTNLSKARSNILIPDRKVLAIKGTNDTAFHPSLKGIQGLYNSGLVTVVQGVSYPNNDYSHFRNIEIWANASNAVIGPGTGWLGRYFNDKFPGYPAGYPNSSFPHPLAIRIGDVSSQTFLGPTEEDMSIGVNENSVSNSPPPKMNFDPAPMTLAGEKVNSIRETTHLAELYSPIIKAVSGSRPNLSTYYPEPKTNPLADQLKMVARLIGGGLKTKVYMLSHGPFDTHYAQVDKDDPLKGWHAGVLKAFSESVSIFMDDIHQMGKQDKVVCMTISDFGRRIASNASYGTDHGSSMPLFLFGSRVKAGTVGTNPVIGPNVTLDDNLAMQYDFRSVYSSLLTDWFGTSKEEVEKVLFGKFPSLDLIKI